MTRTAPPFNQTCDERVLSQWARAISHTASHYRIACSPGAIQANAPWFAGKNKTQA